MNFFEAQAKARRSTTLLVVLFLFGVVGTILLTHLLLMVVWSQYDSGTTATYSSMESISASAAIVLFIVAIGSWYKFDQLSAGGHIVAETLGGRLIPRETTDASERQLLDVVDEMALASGIAAPPVYLLGGSSINAFAAGQTYDDAVIGITRGALESLDRQELQGVIAHEFSHIFNGDMRLNLHIAGLLHGIVLIGLIGRGILRAMDDSGVHRRRSSGSGKKGDAVGAVIMIAVGFTVIGFIGTFFGELIKAMISRQREYLADASAVQYTRYPAGIANALKKIGSAGSEIASVDASSYSHFYFADGVQGFWDHLFSTHPELSERILRIEPGWDGTFIPVVSKPVDAVPERKEQRKKEVFAAVTTAAVLDAIDRVGNPGAENVGRAQALLESISKPLRTMAQHPMSSRAVVLALLTAPEYSIREAQFAFLGAHSSVLLNQTKLAAQYAEHLGEGQRLPLLLQCIVSLKTMSPAQYEEFRYCVKTFADADDALSLFEWTLEHLLLEPLDLQFRLRETPKEIHTHIGAVRGAIESFLSEAARTQYDAGDAARRAFDETVRRAGATALRYDDRASADYAPFDRAVRALQEAKPGVRKKVLDMTVDLLSHDGVVSASDLELLHALASTLRLPIPQVA